MKKIFSAIVFLALCHTALYSWITISDKDIRFGINGLGFITITVTPQRRK